MQYPEYKPEDLGVGIQSSYYWNSEAEMLEAYKRAYDAEQEFENKVFAYKGNLMSTTLATEKLFKPITDTIKDKQPADAIYRSETEAIAKEQDDYLLGVTGNEFKSTIELRVKNNRISGTRDTATADADASSDATTTDADATTTDVDTTSTDADTDRASASTTTTIRDEVKSYIVDVFVENKEVLVGRKTSS